MSSSAWSKVALKGDVQIIPNTCPNCMGGAHNDLRYAYMNPLNVINPTRYYQTFRYCDRCVNPAIADANHRERSAFLPRMQGVLLALLLGVGIMAAIGTTLAQGLDKETRATLMSTLFMVSAAGSYTGLWMLKYFFKSRLMARDPKRDDQAVWGIAAFYTGSGLLDIFDSSKVYTAARREWLSTLVRLNPEQVDDATYQSFVGGAKPEKNTAKPFAA